MDLHSESSKVKVEDVLEHTLNVKTPNRVSQQSQGLLLKLYNYTMLKQLTCKRNKVDNSVSTVNVLQKVCQSGGYFVLKRKNVYLKVVML